MRFHTATGYIGTRIQFTAHRVKNRWYCYLPGANRPQIERSLKSVGELAFRWGIKRIRFEAVKNEEVSDDYSGSTIRPVESTGRK